MTDHPSFLQLDRAALGAEVSGETRVHLATCARCQAHLARVGEPGLVPAWVHAIDRPKRRPWILGGAFALAAACAVVAFVLARGSKPGEAEYTTVKSGAPSYTLHVKRGDAVFAWDGVAPIRPGDHLRLEIAASGYTHLRVLAAHDAPLYEAPIGDGVTLLPTAWTVDATPGDEVLTIVLGDEPSTWRTTLRLPKQLEETPR